MDGRAGGQPERSIPGGPSPQGHEKDINMATIISDYLTQCTRNCVCLLRRQCFI